MVKTKGNVRSLLGGPWGPGGSAGVPDPPPGNLDSAGGRVRWGPQEVSVGPWRAFWGQKLSVRDSLEFQIPPYTKFHRQEIILVWHLCRFAFGIRAWKSGLGQRQTHLTLLLLKSLRMKSENTTNIFMYVCLVQKKC